VFRPLYPPTTTVAEVLGLGAHTQGLRSRAPAFSLWCWDWKPLRGEAGPGSDTPSRLVFLQGPWVDFWQIGLGCFLHCRE
jgi:hypothetical protein